MSWTVKILSYDPKTRLASVEATRDEPPAVVTLSTTIPYEDIGPVIAKKVMNTCTMQASAATAKSRDAEDVATQIATALNKGI
jgi:hypothetical protein